MNLEARALREEQLYELRRAPANIEAEQYVLGALMVAPERLPDIVEILDDDDFYDRRHKLIYAGIQQLVEKQKPADAVTLGDWFAAQGQAREVDGGAYLVDLQANAFSSANVVAYAEIVLEKSKLRQIIDIGTALVNKAFETRGSSAADILSQAQTDMARFAIGPKCGPITYREAVDRWWPNFNGKACGTIGRGMPTPWLGLNEALYGLQDSEAIVLAARSNIGKSVAAFQLARFSALRGQRTLLFSMEMGTDAVVNRDMAAVGEIPHDWMMAPSEEDSENFAKVTVAVSRLRDIDLHIDDSPQLNSRQIAARARRLHLQKPVRLIVVDHLHEMALPGRQGEVIERGQALRDLKALAKELGCPIVILAQLNRGAAKTEQGKARRPTMVDLRGSGAIEEAADVVILMHRWDAYDAKDRPGVVEFIVGKGRNVRTGTVVQQRGRFDIMRIDDWGDERIPEEEVESHAGPPARSFQFRGKNQPQKKTYRRPGGVGSYNPDPEDFR